MNNSVLGFCNILVGILRFGMQQSCCYRGGVTAWHQAFRELQKDHPHMLRALFFSDESFSKLLEEARQYLVYLEMLIITKDGNAFAIQERLLKQWDFLLMVKHFTEQEVRELEQIGTKFSAQFQQLEFPQVST